MSDDSRAPYALGIDLGGSSAKSVAVTPQGEVLSRKQADFDPSVPMQWAETIRELVRFYEREQGSPAASIGVAAPGLTTKDERAIAYMPARLQGLEGLDWTRWLARTDAVPVLNDAHAALLGEVWIGAAKGCENVILLTLGTGVGGAAMVDGNLLRGEIGRAGHLGHTSLNPSGAPDICGAPGSLEDWIGNCTLKARCGGRYETTHDLVKAYLRGEPEAEKVWLESIRGLAAGIAGFINVLDPAVVILGGGIARSGEALFRPLNQFLDSMEWRPGGHRAKIVSAQLGEFAGSLGAARRGILANSRRTTT